MELPTNKDELHLTETDLVRIREKMCLDIATKLRGSDYIFTEQQLDEVDSVVNDVLVLAQHSDSYLP